MTARPSYIPIDYTDGLVGPVPNQRRILAHPPSTIARGHLGELLPAISNALSRARSYDSLQRLRGAVLKNRTANFCDYERGGGGVVGGTKKR